MSHGVENARRVFQGRDRPKHGVVTVPGSEHPSLPPHPVPDITDIAIVLFPTPIPWSAPSAGLECDRVKAVHTYRMIDSLVSQSCSIIQYAGGALHDLLGAPFSVCKMWPTSGKTMLLKSFPLCLRESITSAL